MQDVSKICTTQALLDYGNCRYLEAHAGWRLTEELRDYGVLIKVECDGACACATCHIHI
jgi:ferredoxin